MSLIPFPNVPAYEGVPALPRSPNFPPIAKVGLGLIEGALWRAARVESQWGIFDDEGNALGDPAWFTGIVGGIIESVGLGSTLSTNSFEYTKECRISDFPVERGSFASYNKVRLPATPTVVLALSASEADRTFFLNAIDGACNSTNLYTVATPEKNYVNCSLEGYNYQRRSSNGCTLLLVEIRLKEIRQVTARYGQSDLTSPAAPGATSAASGGNVQPKTPDVSILKSLSNKVKGWVQ